MTKEEERYLVWLRSTTDHYRGLFINRAITVEQIIDEFLAWYFIGNDENKRIQFHQLVLSSIDVTFSQKIKMFSDVVNKFLPSDFDGYKSLLGQLETLRKKRNEFAHSKIDSRQESLTKNFQIESKLYLIKVKNYSMQQVVLEIENLEKQLSEFGKLTEDIVELLKKYIASIEALPS